MRTLLLSTVLSLSPLAAFALPGEASAVIRHCGKPHAEHLGTSVISGKVQRDLIYNDVILHFQPAGSGWSFTTAWRGHLPVTRGGLEESLPCFRSAMEEVASAPAVPIDPTTALQTGYRPMSQSTLGIPHLWLIVVLVSITLILMLIPRRRQEPAHAPIEERPYRKPSLRSRVWRQRPPKSPLR